MESLAKVTTSEIKNTVIDIRSKSARHGGRGVFDLYAERKTLRERKKYKLRLIEDKHARTQRNMRARAKNGNME
jgi:hypothetical protein